MKIFIVLLLYFMFATTGFICAKSTDNGDNSPLPSSRPADITFRYHVDGGMMYYSEELFLSGDSCWYKINDAGAESKTYFKLNDEQLDRLYKTFRDNDFDRIETYTEKVYDRGGEGIGLYWGKNKSCGASSSGITFIDKAWSGEWSACVKAITNIISEEIPKYQKDFEIRLDKTMFNKEIYLQVNRAVIIPQSMLMQEQVTDESISRTVKLSPGSHMISLNIDKKYEMMKINTDSSKGIIFSFNDSTLTYTYIR
jgi:hypothetical protein